MDYYYDEIITRSAPRWAWGIIDETLEADTRSKAFDQDLRDDISMAYHAMGIASERAADDPLSRAEVEAIAEEENAA